MSLADELIKTEGEGAPRASGDEPVDWGTMGTENMCSPRERG